MTDDVLADDHDEYPPDHLLIEIERLSPSAALDLAQRLWHWPDFVRERLTEAEAEVVHADPGERFLRFATGGWSGNESIITALKNNRNLMILCWRLSTRGGLHIFKHPEQPAFMMPTHDEAAARIKANVAPIQE